MDLLLLQAAGPPGTLSADGWAVAADIALVFLGGVAAVTLVAMLILLAQVRRVGRALGDLAHAFEKKVDPLVERGRTIAANLEFISTAVRTDVERLHTSVRALSERLQQASDHMEERIDEFNALMEVVQSEAEGVFLDTASTVRGIRAGAQNLSAPPEQPDVGSPDAVREG